MTTSLEVKDDSAMRDVNDVIILCYDSTIHASMMALAAPSIEHLS